MQVYYVPDLVRFDQVQITDVPKPVSVHLLLDHTITITNFNSYLYSSFVIVKFSICIKCKHYRLVKSYFYMPDTFSVHKHSRPICKWYNVWYNTCC